MATSLPSSARCVIIGGGVIGSSVAYHLSKLGWKNILLLESQKVTSGTTWHAAGLVGTSRATATETRLSVVGTQLYERLKDETGADSGFKRGGSVNVARTKDRMHVLHRTCAKALSFGLEARMLTPDEVATHFTSPKDGVCALRVDDLVGGIHLPGDGSGSPTDLTMSLLAGAKQRGVQVFEGVRVTGFTTVPSPTATAGSPPKITAVHTESHGTVECDVAVLCAGQWSRELGRLAGVNVPLHSAEHFYATTQNTVPGVWPMMPVLRDPDALIYMREWGSGLLFGGFEEHAKPWGADKNGGVPKDFAFSLLPDDWDHFAPLFTGAVERVPALENAQLKLLNGPESFTPDGNYILGEAPECKNFYVAAGMNSSGIASAGGCGLALAEWINKGEPTMDLWPVDIRRFAPFSNNSAYLKDRILETLGLHYTMPYPRKELKSCRNLRQSALFSTLDAKNAVWGQRYGWERPNFFAPTSGVEMSDLYTFGKPKWLPWVAAEMHACRNAVALFDQSSFTKISVSGKDAVNVMKRLCANDVDVDVGRLVYTGMLNERAGYEADVTITRDATERYTIISSTAQTTRDLDWIRRNVKAGEEVCVSDITSQYAVLSLMGPNARKVMQACATFPNALSNESFPFGTSKSVDIGYHRVVAKRVTYVGELGYEIYVPVESAKGVYDELHKVGGGAEFGLKDAGYYAIEALRIEKAYRAWGHELSPDENPIQAGLSFAVDMKGDNKFIGREALEKAKGEKLGKKLFQFAVVNDPDVMLWGGEVVLLDGKIVGVLTSGTFSPTFNTGIGMGYVKHDKVSDKDFGKSNEGKWELVVGEKTVKVKAQIGPFYDPKSERVKS